MPPVVLELAEVQLTPVPGQRVSVKNPPLVPSRPSLQEDPGPIEWPAEAVQDASVGMGPYQNAPGAEDTVAGDVSVEQHLHVDETGPALATVDLDENSEPAEVIAEGGAIRVALSLGTKAPSGRDEVTSGVAVSAVEPVPVSSGWSSDARDLGATDLVKLSRLRDKLGGPGVRIDAMETDDAPLEVGPEGRDEDWLGAEGGKESLLISGMGPFGEDQE